MQRLWAFFPGTYEKKTLASVFNGALVVLQVLGEVVIASNVLMAGGTGTVAVQTCQFSSPPQPRQSVLARICVNAC